MATRRMFKVWHAEDKKLVLATSLDELIEKGLTKLQKTRENFKCLKLSDGTVVDDGELFAFLDVSEPIHFAFSDEEVSSTSTCTGASDHQQTTEGVYGVQSLPSTPNTRTLFNVSFLTPPPTPPPPPHVTTSVEVRQSDMAQSTTTQSTTQIHTDFVKASMVGKGVRKMAGIGPSIGKRLEDKEFRKAYAVLGKYLMLNQNEELFTKWLKDEVGANSKQGSDCYRCLKEWCDNFL